jgi:hypothetical protein
LNFDENIAANFYVHNQMTLNYLAVATVVLIRVVIDSAMQMANSASFWK